MSQRAGQKAFNDLCATDPDLANKVRGNAELDPYYDDANLPRFYEFIAKHSPKAKDGGE